MSYKLISNGHDGKDVLLKDVQKQIWISKQKDIFWDTYDQNKIVNYPADEFSADIRKLLSNSEVRTKNGLKIHLS